MNMKCKLCEEVVTSLDKCRACLDLVCPDCCSVHYGFTWCDICWEIEKEDRGDAEYDPT